MVALHTNFVISALRRFHNQESGLAGGRSSRKRGCRTPRLQHQTVGPASRSQRPGAGRSAARGAQVGHLRRLSDAAPRCPCLGSTSLHLPPLRVQAGGGLPSVHQREEPGPDAAPALHAHRRLGGGSAQDADAVRLRLPAVSRRRSPLPTHGEQGLASAGACSRCGMPAPRDAGARRWLHRWIVKPLVLHPPNLASLPSRCAAAKPRCCRSTSSCWPPS